MTPQITCLGFFTDVNLQVYVFNGKALSLVFLRLYFCIKDHTQMDTFFLCYFTMRSSSRYSLLAALSTCLLSLTRRKHHERDIYFSPSSLFITVTHMTCKFMRMTILDYVQRVGWIIMYYSWTKHKIRTMMVKRFTQIV